VIRLPLILIAFVMLWWAFFRLFKRKSLRIIISIVAGVVAIPLCLFLIQWGWEFTMMFRARHIAAQIENYRGSHGKYPISLSDVAGVPVNGPIYYERDSNSPEVYYMWFGTGFGTVSQYDSKTRSWHGPQ
jgi:hypothetical protein